MAKFVAGKKKPVVALSEPKDLVVWISALVTRYFGKGWSIDVSERVGYKECPILRNAKYREFVLFMTCEHWPKYHGFEIANSLVNLAKQFQEKGWPKLVEYADSMASPAVQATQIKPEHVIESRLPAIESKRLGLPAPKQLALTHKQPALPAPRRTLKLIYESKYLDTLHNTSLRRWKAGQAEEWHVSTWLEPCPVSRNRHYHWVLNISGPIGQEMPGHLIRWVVRRLIPGLPMEITNQEFFPADQMWLLSLQEVPTAGTRYWLN